GGEVVAGEGQLARLEGWERVAGAVGELVAGDADVGDGAAAGQQHVGVVVTAEVVVVDAPALAAGGEELHAVAGAGAGSVVVDDAVVGDRAAAVADPDAGGVVFAILVP